MNTGNEKDDNHLVIRQGPKCTIVPELLVGKGKWGVTPAIIMQNPKYDHNVGAAVRAASCFGVKQVWYTGNRVSLTGDRGYRLPREERMKGYADVQIIQNDRPFDQFKNAQPVCVEFRRDTQPLHSFIHPNNAVYVFGPEDGCVGPDFTRLCHHFVCIPTAHCLNLSVAVAITLYDRSMKIT